MVRGLVRRDSTSGRILDAFRREMDELVGRLGEFDSWSDEMSTFAPRTNIAETDTEYEISVDLPGMKSEDFNIELHEGRLTISGERESAAQEEGKTFHRVERTYGKFRRTFNLGQDVDAEAVSAHYNEGVLTVKVAKTAKAQPKRIQVD